MQIPPAPLLHPSEKGSASPLKAAFVGLHPTQPEPRKEVLVEWRNAGRSLSSCRSCTLHPCPLHCHHCPPRGSVPPGASAPALLLCIPPCVFLRSQSLCIQPHIALRERKHPKHSPNSGVWSTGQRVEQQQGGVSCSSCPHPAQRGQQGLSLRPLVKVLPPFQHVTFMFRSSKVCFLPPGLGTAGAEEKAATGRRFPWA